MDRDFKLTQDHFEIDAEGNLIIDSDAITQGLIQPPSGEEDPPDEFIKIEIG